MQPVLTDRLRRQYQLPRSRVLPVTVTRTPRAAAVGVIGQHQPHRAQLGLIAPGKYGDPEFHAGSCLVWSSLFLSRQALER